MSAKKHSPYNQIAALYDRARPSYPPAIFDDIVALAGLPEKARILEVGCGSGQATQPLAARGYQIDCIELSAALAAIARRKLASYPAVSVRCADFETVALPPASYDLLLAATAFHWLAPRHRYKKTQALLKPGGALALMWNLPVQTAVSQMYLAPLQAVYQEAAPELTENFSSPPPPKAVKTDFPAEIAASGFFEPVQIREHYWAIEYSADSYIDLLGTFSDHIALAPAKRQALFAGIKAVIEAQFDGRITRELVALLYVARRK